MLSRGSVVTFALVASWISVSYAAEPSKAFQEFAQQQGMSFRKDDPAIESLVDWERRRSQLRAGLQKALGGFPGSACELEPKHFGTLQRDGYRVEKIAFQTRPGIWMTANAYVPDRPGKLPAILHVHGHWKGAKQDPVVQSRCIGSVKHGFFVLAVDAFGAGERAIEKNLGEYHGEMTAATLLPIGLPLPGLQVYENMRAVDYLISRPEVDSDRIGITGASGGGNQSMYAGAMDERLHCVVPTCSVGTYQSYLSAACCLCELVPGGIKLTEEGDILGLAANRGMMVTNATKDAFQFSVGEAQKSFSRLEKIATFYPGAVVKHTIVESAHDYNQQMREVMYGWMTLQLKKEGDGSPLPDPAIQTEDPETLRCFPGQSRPDDFVTIPQFAAAEAERLSKLRIAPADRASWESGKNGRRDTLLRLLGGLPTPAPVKVKAINDADRGTQVLEFESEPGLSVKLKRAYPVEKRRLALLINVDEGSDAAWSSPQATELRNEGWSVVAPELRATGQFANPRDKIANAVDHNTAEWAIWIGRPLLGQWVVDVQRTLDAIAAYDGGLPDEILIVGARSSGLAALAAAAIESRISHVRAIETMASYATDRPYRNVRLGLMVPGILKDFGDVEDIAALVAPRQVEIRGGTDGVGAALTSNQLADKYKTTRRVFELLDASHGFKLE